MTRDNSLAVKTTSYTILVLNGMKYFPEHTYEERKKERLQLIITIEIELKLLVVARH